MTVSCQVTRFQKTSTSANGTTQDVALNFTPKAAIVFGCDLLAGVDDTFNEGIYYSYGFSNGTNHACVAVASEDAQATSDTGGTHRTDAVYAYQNTTTPANVLIRGSCSFITNAIRFTWDVNTANTPYIYVIAFSGDDITNVAVNTVNIGDTSTGSHNYTGLGFTPTDGNAILFTCDNNTVNTNTNESICSPSIGCAVSTSKRWAIANTFEDARAASDTWRYFSSARCLASLVDTTGAIDYIADFNGWISDGFQLDVEDASASATNKFSYMVINGGKWDVGTQFAKGSTGLQTTTVDSALAVMRGVFCLTHATSTVDVVSANATISMAANDGTSTGGWAVIYERSIKDPTVNISRHSSNDRLFVTVNTNVGTDVPAIIEESIFDSFGTNTFVLDYITSPVSTTPFGWWAVADSPVVDVQPSFKSFGSLGITNTTNNTIFG